MPATKISYKSRIPTVLKIIKEAKQPIGYTELHKRLIKETGIKLSKHTLNKCLKQLCIENKINRTDEEGVGNPTKYSMNIESNSIPHEHITEDNHWRILGDEISGIICQLIWMLYEYAQRNDGKELQDFKDRIEIALVPRLLETHKLVKDPVIMSEKTTETLDELFCESYKTIRNKYYHQPYLISKEDHEKMSQLVWELEKYYLNTKNPDLSSLMKPKNCKPIQRGIKHK
ncbi:hypothetical protein [Methanosarcina sp. UBA5]|uniref:hypothetical protein n=1 Tax=Methanosarcina sp. UBA5 TaxID=1915593 RepID=UPI0025DEF71A|nr:hypothetical protein [Methanosarcina sp. UBA5]